MEASRTSSAAEVPATEFYLDTNVKLAGKVLKPEFGKHLEAFYSKARTPEDRARCLELLTALDIGNAVNGRGTEPVTTEFGCRVAGQRRRRPVTVSGYHEVPFDPYLTSHKREFPWQPQSSTDANRPRSTVGAFHCPSSDMEKRTTYADEFCGRVQPRPEHIRSGSASGNRRNNPHPLQAFMTWRMGRRENGNHDPGNLDTERRVDESMDGAIRGKLESVYQRDYLALPLGSRPKPSATPLITPGLKPDPPYTLDTTTRHTFRIPLKVDRELGVPSTRFASGVYLTGSSAPAIGAVPGASSTIYLNTSGRTTYERHFTNPHGNTMKDIRHLGKRHGADSLAKHLETLSNDADKKELIGVFKCLRKNSPSFDAEAVERTSYSTRCKIPRSHSRVPQPTSTFSTGPLKSVEVV